MSRGRWCLLLLSPHTCTSAKSCSGRRVRTTHKSGMGFRPMSFRRRLQKKRPRATPRAFSLESLAALLELLENLLQERAGVLVAQEEVCAVDAVEWVRQHI